MFNPMFLVVIVAWLYRLLYVILINGNKARCYYLHICTISYGLSKL